jgi:thiol-disulfide isomerase/thioredoxin
MRTLTAIAIALCLLAPSAQAKHAPNLELKDRAGNTHKLAELRGSIVVFNFWATWCGPCREELPLLARLSQEYGQKNGPTKIRFIAASADDIHDPAKVEKFWSSQQLDARANLIPWLGADLDMLDSAALGNLLPATMILDEQGEVITRIEGQAREADIRTALDWLLGGRQGPAPGALIKRF